MLPSKFLKQADVPAPALVSLTHITKEKVNQQDEPDESKWVAHFREYERPLVLNTTNLNALALIFDSEDSDDWKGTVVIYTDPTIGYGGKITGGLRLRAPKKQSAPEKMAEVAARETGKPRVPAIDLDDEDPLPF
jgi:hypothetical protein